MKNILIIFLLLLTCFTAQGQNKHRGWGGHFDVRTNNGLVMNTLAASAWNYVADSLAKAPWLGCRIEGVSSWGWMWSDWNTLSEIHAGDSTLYTSKSIWWNPFVGDDNYEYDVSLGYSAGYQWKWISAYAGLKYEWRGFSICEGPLKGVHAATNIVPSTGVTVSLGKVGTIGVVLLANLFEAFAKASRTNSSSETDDTPYFWSSEGGISILKKYSMDFTGSVSWVKNITYKGPLSMGTAAINDGFRFSAGLLLSVLWTKRPVNLGLFYERDLYSHFNVPGVETKSWRIMSTAGFVL